MLRNGKRYKPEIRDKIDQSQRSWFFDITIASFMLIFGTCCILYKLFPEYWTIDNAKILIPYIYIFASLIALYFVIYILVIILGILRSIHEYIEIQHIVLDTEFNERKSEKNKIIQ
jgi:hypothetical protein